MQNATTQSDLHSSTTLHTDLNKLQPPIQTQQFKSTPIQNTKLNNWNARKTQPPIYSPWLHHSHRFKQAPATETNSKTHHESRRFKPMPIQTYADSTHDANSITHANSTHLWNPATDSTSIPELSPTNTQTTTTNPNLATIEPINPIL